MYMASIRSSICDSPSDGHHPAWMVANTSATATAATPACCPVRNLGSPGQWLGIFHMFMDDEN